MADNDVGGHLRALVQLCESPAWAEFWREAQCELGSFDELGLPEDAMDAEVWWACQQNGVVLITANRNTEGPHSLEITIRQPNNDQCLPEQENTCTSNGVRAVLSFRPWYNPCHVVPR